MEHHIDGQAIPDSEVDVQAQVRRSLSRTVPESLYLDGTITVCMVRPTGQLTAMINEIALEEITLGRAATNLTVSKSVDPTEAGVGDTVTFTVSVTNEGPAEATNVQLTDALPDGLDYESDDPSQGSFNASTGVWTVGTLADGASATLELSATVSADAEGQTVTNTVSGLQADQDDRDPDDNIASAAVEVAAAPDTVDLSVSKKVDLANANEGDEVEFTMEVTNPGTPVATGVSLIDLLPEGLTYDSDDPDTGNYDDGTGLWTIGALAGGETASLTLRATVDDGTAGDTLTNTTSDLELDQEDPNAENDTASAAVQVLSADLAVTKNVDKPAPDEGQQVVFTIEVTNNGPDDATGIQLTDQLPVGLTYVSDDPDQGSYDDLTGVWTVGALADGASASLEITATVDSGTSGQTIINATSALSAGEADLDSSNDSASAQITVDVAAADVQVLTLGSSSTTPAIGSSVVISIAVRNDGPSAASGLKVQVDLPSCLAYSTHSTLSGTYSGGTEEWNIGGLASGATANLSVTAQVIGLVAEHVRAEVTAQTEPDGDSTPGNGDVPDEDDRRTLAITPPRPSCQGQTATIVGTTGNDGLINGTEGPDVIVALAGNDTIEAKGGADLICAGDGADTVFAGDGDDDIYGDRGADGLFGGAGNDYIEGGPGNDEIYGGLNVLSGPDADEIYGNGGADTIEGGIDDDIIEGGNVRDVMRGGAGDDAIRGFQGADDLFGDAGDDAPARWQRQGQPRWGR
jgi:uncharacterized repeat protein (TIGR01451 family)